MDKHIRDTIFTNNFIATYAAVQGAKSRSESSDSYVSDSGKKTTMYSGSSSEKPLPKLDYEIIESFDPRTKFSHENLKKIAPEIASFVEKLQTTFTVEMDKMYSEKEKVYLKIKEVQKNYDKIRDMGFTPFFSGKYELLEKKTVELGAGIEFTKADIESSRNLFKENIDKLNQEYPNLEAKRKEAYEKYVKYSKYGGLVDVFKKLEKKYYDAKNKFNLYDAVTRKLGELKEYSDIYEKLTPEDKKVITQALKEFDETGLGSGDIENELRSIGNDLSKLFNCNVNSSEVKECLQTAEKKVLESLTLEEKEKYENIGKIVADAFSSISQKTLSQLPTRTKDLEGDTNKNTYLQDVIYLAAMEELEKIKNNERDLQTQKAQADKQAKTTQKGSSEQGYTY